MIVQCVTCKARLRVADEQVPEEGIKLRCSKCKSVFRVRRAVVVAPRAESPASAALSSAPQAQASGSADIAAATDGAAPAHPQAAAPQERTELFGNRNAPAPASPSPAPEVAESPKKVSAFEADQQEAPAVSAPAPAVSDAPGAAAEVPAGGTALFGEPPAEVQASADALEPAPPASATQLFGQGSELPSAASTESTQEASASALLEASLFGAPTAAVGGASGADIDGSAALEAQLFGAAGAGAPAGEAPAGDSADLFDLPMPAAAAADPQAAAAEAEPAAPELLPAETSGIEELFEDFDASAPRAIGPGDQAPEARAGEVGAPQSDGEAAAAGSGEGKAAPLPADAADAAAGSAPAESLPAVDALAPAAKSEKAPADAASPADAQASPPAHRRGSAAGAIFSVLAILALFAAIALAALYEPVRAEVRQFVDGNLGHLIEGLEGRAQIAIEAPNFSLAETRSGKKLLVLTCRVRNQGAQEEVHRRVRVDLMRGQKVVAQTTAILGMAGRPEGTNLYEIVDDAALEQLWQKQLAAGSAIASGAARPLVAIFRDYPSDLAGHRISFHWEGETAAQKGGR